MLDSFELSKLKRKYGDEKVLVVPRNLLNGVPDKFHRGNLNRNLASSIFLANTFIYRYEAEYNNAFYQLIPYIIVTNKKEDKFYVTERISGEERLKGKYQLGASGHVNPIDLDIKNTLENAAFREMNEELFIKDSNEKLYYYGTVQDSYSKTSEHLGIVYIYHCDNVSVREEENLNGKWLDIFGLFSKYELFESWARLIIDHLYQNYTKTKKTLIFNKK